MIMLMEYEENIIYLNGTLNEPEVEIKPNERFLHTTDEMDTICVFIPEKYRRDSKINMLPEENFLLNFYNNLDIIRKQNLTLRDITLNHILVLRIDCEEHGWTELYLNLGLNPYLYFNDYIVSELNSAHTNQPILTLKRYKKFNPYNEQIFKIIDKTRIVINKEDIDDLEYFKENINCDDYNSQYIYIDEFINDNDIQYEYDLWRVQYQERDTDSKIFLINEMLSKLKKKIVSIENTDNPETVVDNYENNNLMIWKYGTIDNPVDKKEFEWLHNNGNYKEYELVMKHTFITTDDFKHIVGKDFEELEYYHKYKKQALDRIRYEEQIYKIKEKLLIIGETSLCCDTLLDNDGVFMRFSSLRTIINTYILHVQNYLLKGEHSGLVKYIKREELFNTIFKEDKLYEKLLNNGIFFLLEEALKNYEDEVVNNEIIELQMPDIYILLGFYTYPCKFNKELWLSNQFSNEKKWWFVIKSLNFLESTGWYYMYGLCCFFAQIIGPSFYIYNYYLIEHNDYCPNNSPVVNKFFAIAYYLVLYARQNSFWRNLTTTVWQYGNTTVITHNNYLRLTLLINSICLYIVPIFTYTLFIELSGITDLILNCLTGEFLVNLDNLIVEFIGENDYIKSLTKDLLVFSFLDTGFPKKNIMEGNTIELWLVTLIQVIQMIYTLVITIFVYHCI